MRAYQVKLASKLTSGLRFIPVALFVSLPPKAAEISSLCPRSLLTPIFFASFFFSPFGWDSELRHCFHGRTELEERKGEDTPSQGEKRKKKKHHKQ